MASSKNVRAGRAFVELVLRDFVSAGLKAIQAKLKAFAASVRAAGLAMVKLGSLIAAPLGLAALSFAKMGDELQKMSMRTGTTVEFLSALSYAAEIAGTSVQDMEKGFKSLAKFMLGAGQGLATQNKALTALGLSFKDLKGLGPEDQFMIMTEALSKVEDKTLKAGLAMQVFGRAGASMLPMIDQGSAGIKRMMERAEKLGLVMSGADADQAAILTDKMTDLWKTVKMAVFHIGAGLAPMITKAAEKMREWTTIALKWIKNHRDVIKIVAKVALGILGLGVALLILSGPLTLAAAGISGLLLVAGVLQGVLAFLVSPLGLIAGALVLVTHATGNLTKVTKQAGSIVKESWDGIKKAATTAFGGVTDALMSGEWQLAAEIAFLGIKSAWLSGIRPLREAWIGFQGWWESMILGMGTFLMKEWNKAINDMAEGIFVIMTHVGMAGDVTKLQVAKEIMFMRKQLADKNDMLDANRDAAAIVRAQEAAAAMAAIGDEMAAARNDLEKAREEARKKREEHEKRKREKQDDLKIPGLPDLDELFGPGWDAFEPIAKKIAASGAFSSAAVARMGGGIKAPEEETAKNTAKTVEVLEDMEKILFGGLHQQRGAFWL